MFFCRLHQPQQSALCKVVKDDVTLDSMSTVKGKVDTRSDDDMIFLFWQHLCFFVCLFALYSIIMSLSGRYLPLDMNPACKGKAAAVAILWMNGLTTNVGPSPWTVTPD